MTQLAPSATVIAAPASGDAVRSREDRLPIGHSVLIIAALSLGLWAGIGFLIRWSLG